MNSKEYISSGILESYILGLASPEEAGILECVLKNNSEVKQAFEETQKTLEMLATAQAVTPPADLKLKIWDKIQQEQNIEEIEPMVPSNEPRFNIGGDSNYNTQNTQEIKEVKNSNWKTYAIAASLLFLLSIGSNLYWLNSQSEIKKQISRLETEKKSQNIALQNIQQKFNIVSNPDMLKIVMSGVEKHPDAKATVFWDKNSKDVFLTANSLPKAPEGMQYQLWAIADGKPISAGMYSEEKDSEIALSNIPKAQAFAITLEKKGGSEVPTMENMYVMGGI